MGETLLGLLDVVLELLAVGLVTDGLLFLLGSLESVLEPLLSEVKTILEVLDVVVHAEGGLALLLGVGEDMAGSLLVSVDTSSGSLEGAIGSWSIRRCFGEGWIAVSWPWTVLWSLVVGVELLAKPLLGVLEVGLSPEDVSVHAKVWYEVVDWIFVGTDGCWVVSLGPGWDGGVWLIPRGGSWVWSILDVGGLGILREEGEGDEAH